MSRPERSAGAPEGAADDIVSIDPAARAGAHAGVASDIASMDPAARAGAHATHASNGAGAARAISSSADPAAVAAHEVSTGAAGATCAGCGAPLAPDQRYCLACGQPASPVRLAFLDVLQGEYRPAQGVGSPGGPPPAAAYYAPPPEPDGLLGGLRRYSGLLALTGVLLAALLIGLLVGHWVTGGNGSASSGKQVIEVKGLSGALAAAPAATTGNSATGAESTGGGSASHHSAKQEANDEAKEVKEVHAAKAPPVVHKKTSATSLQKLNKTTGKQHAKEVNSLIKGDEPIETGN